MQPKPIAMAVPCLPPPPHTHAQAQALLVRNRAALDALVELLLDKEKLLGAEVEEVRRDGGAGPGGVP